MFVGSKKILKVPAFDLDWCDVDGTALALLPGGGGSTKSGVRNQIQLVTPDEAGFVYTALEGFLTEEYEVSSGNRSGLCSGISTGMLSNGVQVVCTLIDDRFLLLGIERVKGGSLSPPSPSLKVKKGQPSYLFTRLAEVKADFAKEVPTVNCCKVVSVTTME